MDTDNNYNNLNQNENKNQNENQNEIIKNKKKRKKSNVPKCNLDGCNKKLRLTDMACRCGKKFCGNHRVWSDHNCTYDYKSSERKELEKNNEKIVGEKLNKM